VVSWPKSFAPRGWMLQAAQRDLAAVYPTAEEPEDHGPTHIVPLPVTAGIPALSHGYLRSRRPGFYEHERSGAGPAGTRGATAPSIRPGLDTRG
jgi:hypothetical protein